METNKKPEQKQIFKKLDIASRKSWPGEAAKVAKFLFIDLWVINKNL